MKRWIFLMAALIALTGCAAEPEDPASKAPPEPTVSIIILPGETESPKAPETASDSSVQVHALNRTGCTGTVPMGDDLLLFSGTDAATLTLLSGDDLVPSAEAELNCPLSPDSPALHVDENTVTYYDASTGELVTLDKTLAEVSRFSLPDSVIGSPALSADGKTVYYCCADSVRFIDLNTRLDKLLREISYTTQEVTGLHADGTVLECTFTDDGEQNTLFLSAKTGETLRQITGRIRLHTMAQSYLAVCSDGTYQELLVGSGDGTASLLNSGAEFHAAAAADHLGWAVVAHTYESENATGLACFDPVSGLKTASLTLSGTEPIRGIRGDSQGTGIWFLRYDPGLAGDVLCRWDTAADPSEDTASYLEVRYTRDAPDTEGLARCAATAARLSETYGVEVYTWNDVEPFATDEYPLISEHQVSLTESSLQQLEDALSRYPEGFLEKAASATDSGVLKICLVRSVGNGETGAQYWTSDSACIALCVGGSLEQNFHHQLFYLIENRVMGKSSAYDNWQSLNPDRFSYTLDVEAAEALEDPQWLEGKDRAFIDRRSMSFPREDRAAIMEHAMMAGNEALFESDIMQQKLTKLCQGIRTAFGLKDTQEILLWEQYLKEPLTK